MAARAKRAVRVGPGTMSDRRASAGCRGDGTSQSSPRPAGSAARETSSKGPALSHNSGELPVQANRPLERRTQDAVPVISVRDPYSILYEMECHRGAFEVLLLLHEEGLATASRLRQRLAPGQEANDGCLRFLVHARFVRLNRPTDFPFAKTYQLTAWGKDLVEAPVRSWPYVLVR